MVLADVQTVITGSPRSGTKFIKKVLGLSGVPCSREVAFNVTPQSGFEPARVEASWMAAGMMDRLPTGSMVIHQYCHPLSVLRSLQAFDLLTHTGPRKVFRDFVYEHVDLQGLEGGNLLAAFWVRWNQLVRSEVERFGHEYRRHKVEDLQGAKLVEFCRSLGATESADKIVELGRKYKGTNKRPGHFSVPPFDLSSVTDSSIMSELQAEADLLGYDLSVDPEPVAGPAGDLVSLLVQKGVLSAEEAVELGRRKL